MSSSSSEANLPLVQVDRVGKSFRLYGRPSDRLKQMLFGRMRTFYREFKALKDISLTVYPGETVGIIGRNGAGKSTLLQIITGTLEPTQGTVTTRGRIAALLELGSGINPELTGRENIQLLASILGLDSQEIKARTPAIIEFAALGEHIEQAVKTYSSGMYVRLAFAIATCVDPDVLIVDEALSVGDVAFRNKCMARISELRARKVSVLFVSHDLSTLQMICDRAIWIEDGLVRDVGDPVRITQDFHAFMTGGQKSLDDVTFAPQSVPQHVTDFAEFKSFGIERERGAPYQVGEDVSFHFDLLHHRPVPGSLYAISVYRRDGDWLIGQTSSDDHVTWPSRQSGEMSSGSITLKGILLGPGEYVACIAAYSEDLTLCYAMTELNVAFEVRSAHPIWGKIVHPIEWSVR